MDSILNKSLRSVAIVMLAISVNSINMIAQNPWTRKADFGGPARYLGTGFSIEGKGYIGIGRNGSFYRDFWEYSPSTNSWTQKADFAGSERFGAVGFSIGDKGYIGTGWGYSSTKNDFWEYDPATNSWTRKADFGGPARYFGTGFSIGGKGYIGIGKDLSSYFKDFWEYDPITNTWTRKADFSGSLRWLAVGFSVRDKGYIGTGADSRGISSGEFWQYDPATNVWTRKTDFGGGLNRSSAVGFSIGDKGYIGTGGIAQKDFWEYDPITNTWTQKHEFSGTGRFDAVGFSIGEKGYIGTGLEWGGTYLKDFWEYDPKKLLPDQVRLLYPVDSDTVVLESGSSQVQFLWQRSPVATYYGLEISADSSFAQIVFQDTAMMGTKYLWEIPEVNKTYWWRVRAGNQYGWGRHSVSGSFTCVPGKSKSIDIMVVYPPAAENFANSFGGVSLAIAQAMIIGQQVLDNSDARASIRLVYSGPVEDYGSPDPPDLLSKLTDPNDGFLDGVHQLRMTYGADLVVLLSPSLGGGQAWLLRNTSGSPSLGFSIVGVTSALLGDYAFIHEIGHNMGSHHSRSQPSAPAPASGGLFVYSTGWHWKGTDGKGYCDVMSYAQALPPPQSKEITAPIFSNPDILWAGTPTGSYDTNNPYAPADNARTIREIASVIAGYSSRLTPTYIADIGNFPATYTLHQNYPNPLNPLTIIKYDLPQKSYTHLVVYNLLGQEIETLVEGEQEAGTYSVDWQAKNLPAGIYFYRLQAGQYIETKKMLLLR